MEKQVSAERLVNILLTMIDDIAAMTEGYAKYPDVIEREFAIIKEGRYGKLDEIVQQKVELSDAIEKHFESLNAQARYLLIMYKEHFVCEQNFVSDLSHCDRMLSDLINLQNGKNVIVEQTLKHHLARFRKELLKFQETASRVKPVLEVNRSAITQISQNYIESNRFWRDLNEERNAPYDRSGVQRSHGQNSAIVAKA